MRRPQKSRRVLIEDFVAFRTATIRKLLGGAKQMKQIEMIVIELPDGRKQLVNLVPQQTNIGETMKIFECPTCLSPVRVLRAVPGSPSLACAEDLRRDFGARYRSQVCPKPVSRFYQPLVEVVEPQRTPSDHAAYGRVPMLE